MIRVVLPAHLRTLAGVEGEVRLDVPAPATIGGILDALEDAYPMLKGTIRDHGTTKRRSFLRFFACGRDLSFLPTGDVLPEPIGEGSEPFRIVGAIAGG